MAPAAHAQSVATVLGTVTDATGAAVPGASITLVDTRTNTPYYAKTSSDGAYRIPDVAPGPGYSLSVKKDGFQVFVVNSLYLPVATATTQDIKLGRLGHGQFEGRDHGRRFDLPRHDRHRDRQ